MTYELEKGQIDNARTLRSEYELVEQMSDEHLLKWSLCTRTIGSSRGINGLARQAEVDFR